MQTHIGGRAYENRKISSRAKSCESLFIEVLLQIVGIGMYRVCFVFLSEIK